QLHTQKSHSFPTRRSSDLKVPHVKRLVFKSVPEGTTRLAMLKKGEVDVAYDLDVPAAEEVKRDPKLKLAFSGGVGSFYIDFIERSEEHTSELQSPYDLVCR